MKAGKERERNSHRPHGERKARQEGILHEQGHHARQRRAQSQRSRYQQSRAVVRRGHIFPRQTQDDSGTVKAHARVNRQKDQKEAIIAFAHGMIENVAVVIKARHVRGTVPVVFGACDFANEERGTLSIGHVENIVVRVIVVLLECGSSNVTWAGFLGENPRENTTGKDNKTHKFVVGWNIATRVNGRVDFQKDDGPSTVTDCYI